MSDATGDLGDYFDAADELYDALRELILSKGRVPAKWDRARQCVARFEQVAEPLDEPTEAVAAARRFVTGARS